MPLPWSSHHLLLVEDDPAVQEALACGLAGTYLVHSATTGREACALLRTHCISAIILDVLLGEECGLDLIPHFHTISHAPVVILTGHGSEDVAVRALRAGATDYLKKPVGLSEVRICLARVLQLDRAAKDPPNPADRICRQIVALREVPQTVRSLASNAGVSERHLRRLFHETVGHTPQQHLAEIRDRNAADLLRRSDLSIKQVAYTVGYPSLRTFGRAFKRLHGISPSAFRRRARSGERSPTT